MGNSQHLVALLAQVGVLLCRDMLRAHNALLHVYATFEQAPKAQQLYDSMQERGPAVDSISASTLIAAYAKVLLLARPMPSNHNRLLMLCCCSLPLLRQFDELCVHGLLLR